MTVLDVLETASLYLNLRDEFDYYFNEDNITEPSSEIKNKFSTLLNALNLTIKEVATEFRPVYCEELATFENGETSLDSLSKDVNKIISVCDNFKGYNFCIVNNNLKIDDNGEKLVKYSCIPDELDVDDDIDFFEGVSEKTLAFGTCMEYFYLQNIFDEVQLWEERFYKSLKNSLRNFGKYNLPKRRWI